MNAFIGSSALVVALLASLVTVVVSALAQRSRSGPLRDLSRHGVYVVFATVAVAAAALLKAFIEHDFSIKYVQRYSDLRQPLVYLFTAFWGGQPGSLLFWVVVLCSFSAAAAYLTQRRSPELMPSVHAVLMTVAAFFLVLLIFVTNPFEPFAVIDAPADGHGLNPLLQNYWMAIHPPMLLTGYASMAIPFSFGMAALLSGRLNLDWIKVTRRWLLIGWMFLGVGCLLGGRWAYEELGWGGYWAWDPVENAAILPWFTGTALLHSVMVQENRGMLKRWNIFLLIVTFWLSVFGTFLTRSGILDSVHTFAESGIGPWFLGFVGFIALFGGGVLAWRWRELAPKHHLNSRLSRESMFLFNNWIFLAFTFVVLWGTLFPKFKQVVTGRESGIGPPWFNRFAFPLALLLLVVMALGTLIAWRRASRRNLQRNFTKPLVIAAVLAPTIALAYYGLRLRALQPGYSTLWVIYAALALTLVVFNLAVIGIEFARGVRTRRTKSGLGPVGAFFSLLSKHRRRYGGYLVHVGFLLIVLGIAGNAFKIHQRTTLRAGESVALGDYLVTFQGIEVEQHPEKVAFFSRLTVRQCARSGSELDLTACGSESVVRPARFDYNDYSRLNGMPDPSKLTSEVAISMTPLEDIYIAPSGMQVQENIASFEMFVNPLVFWLWLGGVVLLGATILCLWPERVAVRHASRLRSLRPAFGGLAMLALAVLPALVLLVGETVEAQPSPDEPETAAAVAAQPVAGPGEVHLIEATRREGSQASQVYSLIRCRCEGCGGATLSNCPPTCADGRYDRNRIDAWLAEGRTVDEIKGFFVAERGEAALAIPSDPVAAWGIPIAGVFLGAFLVWMALRALGRRRGDPTEGREGATSGHTVGSPTGYQERLALELSELD